MLKTTRCSKCGHEFEQLRTNKLDHLVLAHKLRGIISPYSIGSHCPRCSRDCSDIPEIQVAGYEAAILYLAETDLTEETEIDDSLPLFETSDSDQFVTQIG